MIARIQRKRTKGWRIPAGVIYIGRGSKWGNPFKLVGGMIYVDAGHYQWTLFYQEAGYTTEDVVRLFRDMLMDLNSHPVDDAIRSRFRLMRDTIGNLSGKTIACWCKVDACCHGDALAELANCA